MSVARGNLVEYISDSDGNDAGADSAEKALLEFPDAEILLHIKTSSTSAVPVSVYPDTPLWGRQRQQG